MSSLKASGTDTTELATVVLGLDTAVPLSSPENRAFWRKDRRMAMYHNASKINSERTSTNNDNPKVFLTKARVNPSLLRADEAVSFFGREIGSKETNFMLRSEEDLDVSVSLSQLGMDSLVGVEMRGWWRQAFSFDISLLELLGMGSLAGLGKHAANGLLSAMSEVA